MGAVVGLAMGHVAGAGVRYGLRRIGGIGLLPPWRQPEIPPTMMTAAFYCLGSVAAAGPASTASDRYLRELMGSLRLSAAWRETAYTLYETGRRADFPFDAALLELRGVFDARPALRSVFFEWLVHMAAADGPLSPAADRLLLRACDRLRFPQGEYRRMRTRNEARWQRAGRRHDWFGRPRHRLERHPLAHAYAELELSIDATEHEVRQAYRRLLGRHHPDRAMGQGSSEEAVRAATERTRRVKEAYDAIRKARGIR